MTTPVEPYLVQAAGNEVANYQSYRCRVTFDRPTTENNLVVVVATISDDDRRLSGPPGFTWIGTKEDGRNRFKMAAWYRAGAPAMSYVEVTASKKRAMIAYVMEYAYVRQTAPLDKVLIVAANTVSCRTGTTVTAQDDSVVIAAIMNETASCYQTGFTGGFIKVRDSVTPLKWGPNFTDRDDERHRLTVHQAVTTSISTVGITWLLSVQRSWVAFLLVFKGGSAGPKRMTAKTQAAMLTTSGTGGLTAFGPLRSVNQSANTMLAAGVGTVARVGPFNYQYRLGGFAGLLIGDDTDYKVESVEGLEGWSLRTSDDELPRGDGALRGVDLQSARIIAFKMAFTGTHEQIEDKADYLYRALIPQRDEDWPLIWRHPGRPLRVVYCRPTDLAREISQRQLMKHDQSFALRAADPRHYSVVQYEKIIPVTPASAAEPFVMMVLNIGNAPAYPVIRITGPSSGPDVSRIVLRNATTDTVFDVSSTLAKGSTLIGDMPARATGANRSIVTVDDVSKYGAWQFPRQAFRLNPGANDISLQVTPAGAPVTCMLTYRDTWSG